MIHIYAYNIVIYFLFNLPFSDTSVTLAMVSGYHTKRVFI